MCFFPPLDLLSCDIHLNEEWNWKAFQITSSPDDKRRKTEESKPRRFGIDVKE